MVQARWLCQQSHVCLKYSPRIVHFYPSKYDDTLPNSRKIYELKRARTEKAMRMTSVGKMHKNAPPKANKLP